MQSIKQPSVSLDDYYNFKASIKEAKKQLHYAQIYCQCNGEISTEVYLIQESLDKFIFEDDNQA